MQGPVSFSSHSPFPPLLGRVEPGLATVLQSSRPELAGEGGKEQGSETSSFSPS